LNDIHRAHSHTKRLDRAGNATRMGPAMAGIGRRRWRTAWMTAWAVMWLALIVGPIAVVLANTAISSLVGTDRLVGVLIRSAVLAGGIAAVAVAAGLLPGRVIAGTDRWAKVAVVVCMLSLVLPRHVLYYGWSILLGPRTVLGRWLVNHPDWARTAGTTTAGLVLALWYWPIAALVSVQGWRRVRPELLDAARLEGGRAPVRRRITLSLLRPAMGLAFLVCFVSALADFTTFHLAGVRTIGTELAAIYDMTGRIACPPGFVLPAAGLAVAATLGIAVAGRRYAGADPGTIAPRRSRWDIVVWVGLSLVSLAVPIGLMAYALDSTVPFVQFLRLHGDELAYSVGTGLATAPLAFFLAYGAMRLAGPVRRGPGSVHSGIVGGLRRGVSAMAPASLVFAMFLPASLMAMGLLVLAGSNAVTAGLRDHAAILPLGLSMRFAGPALILSYLLRSDVATALDETARLEGAGAVQRWRYVHLPRTWPVVAAALSLITLFSVTEVSATMVLLPAGMPNFSQRLLNQMHYARDPQVIASCLVLTAVFAVLSVGLVGLFRLAFRRRVAWMWIAAALLVGVAGCKPDGPERRPRVVDWFGQTGRAPGCFVYPRAIARYGGDELFIVDKTGRIQRFRTDGTVLGGWSMPQIEAGKPVGLSVGPDGRLYVADTHYHRVMVYDADGRLVRQWGHFGEDDGGFIYPTDVEFGPDGRIYVSEYGGNDRISVFDGDGRFLFAFGRFGDGPDGFGRPSAMCMDRQRGLLYVADACNHRISVWTADGEPVRRIGSAGRGPGQLRYPYDLVLLDDGVLAVCEYGNNRIQLLDLDGQCLGLYGRPGRALGELAYPWGVAVDEDRRAYVIDSGNDRIQVWQL